MVEKNLEQELYETIKRYGVNSKEAYYVSMCLAFELEQVYNNKKTIQSYYNKSINALMYYMKENLKNPSEKEWDTYIVDKTYLSSKSMGYIFGNGFNQLCKQLRKKMNKQQKHKKEKIYFK